MRILYIALAVACIALAGCSDGDSNVNLGANAGNGGGDGNNGGNVNDLSSLVIQQCTTMPENQDPVAINGRRFAAGANDPNNQAFTNACL